jgi:ATP-dependent Clp protease, protease subunit
MEEVMSEHYLVFTAQINQISTNALSAYLVDLQRVGAKKLTIAISSIGGNVINGITMYNHLIAMPFIIDTHNIGNVDSMANAIFLAGAVRRANETSTFMFHGVGFEGNANERLEEKNLLEKLDTIEADNKRISKIISAHTSLNEKQSLGLFKQQKTRDAQWAKDNGFISEIVDFKLPTGGDVKYLH